MELHEKLRHSQLEELCSYIQFHEAICNLGRRPHQLTQDCLAILSFADLCKKKIQSYEYT